MQTLSIGSHRSNNLDALRLLFAGLVLFSHSIELVDGDRSHEPFTKLFHTISIGEIGVDAFFILSGYLITKSFQSNPNALSFLTKRILRIYPAFIVASLISVLFVGALGSANSQEYYSSLWLRQIVSECLKLKAPGTPPTFIGLPYPIVNGSMWTVQFEFIGYLFLLCIGKLGVFNRTSRLACLFLVSLTAYFLFHGHIPDYYLDRLTRFLPMLLSGALFYKTQLHSEASLTRIGIATIFLFAGLFHPKLAEIAVATCGAYIIFSAGFLKTSRRSLLGNKPDISYGIYLYGWPFQMLVIWYGVTQPLAIFCISAFAAAAAGYLSWHLLEKHALALTSRLPRKDDYPSTLAV